MAAATYTIKQVIAGFAVGHMTISNWRKGTLKQAPLPHSINEKGGVSFKVSEVKAWAKKFGRAFDETAAGAVEAGKPGPTPAVKKIAAEKPKNKPNSTAPKVAKKSPVKSSLPVSKKPKVKSQLAA